MEKDSTFLDFLKRCTIKDKESWNTFIEKYGGYIYLYINKTLRRYDVFSQNGEAEEVVGFIDDQKKKLRELSLRTVLKIADLRKSFPGNWKEMAEVTVMKTGRYAA